MSARTPGAAPSPPPPLTAEQRTSAAYLRARGHDWDAVGASLRREWLDLRRAADADPLFPAALEGARAEATWEAEGDALQRLRLLIHAEDEVVGRRACEVLLAHARDRRRDETRLAVERLRADAQRARAEAQAARGGKREAGSGGGGVATAGGVPAADGGGPGGAARAVVAGVRGAPAGGRVPVGREALDRPVRAPRRIRHAGARRHRLLGRARAPRHLLGGPGARLRGRRARRARHPPERPRRAFVPCVRGARRSRAGRSYFFSSPFFFVV